MDVIARCPCRAAAPRIPRAVHGACVVGHSSISMPSQATSMPRARARARSARVLVEDRVRVVDVDQHLARRRRQPRRATRACRPRRSAADGPCRAHVCARRRGAIISSSVQNVPSTSTQARGLHRTPDARRRSRRARARRTAERPVDFIGDQPARCCRRAPATRGSASTAPACSRTGSARQRTPGTPSTAKPRRSSAIAVPLHAAVVRKHVENRIAAREICIRAVGAPERPAAAALRATCTGRWCDRSAHRPARCRRWRVSRTRARAAARGLACSCARMSGEALTSAQAAVAAAGDGDRRLRARPARAACRAHAGAIAAIAVPLRKAAAGGGAQHPDFHEGLRRRQPGPATPGA